MNRQVCKQPISCEHCGYLSEQFVEYFDGASWCSLCTHSGGAISDEQLQEDIYENLGAAAYYYINLGERLRRQYQKEYGVLIHVGGITRK